MNDYKLKNKWTLWYHSINNKSWTNDSYVKVIELRTLLDYKLLENIFRINHLQNGMFFIMKNDIFPTWEDPNNRLGGCISFKYDNNYSSPPAYPERINTINKAIKLKKNLAFNYYKVKQKKWMKRKVMPDELTKEIWIDGKTKFMLDNLYLVGHCHLRDDKRTFRLDRMKGLKISK